jgi:hypothetical protein
MPIPDLSLRPAIDRILHTFDGLKSFCYSEENVH